MTDRIPLWVDLSDVPDQEREVVRFVAEQVGAEHIFEGRKDWKGIEHIVIQDVDDQIRAAKAKGIVVVDASHWTIIPFENLIAARQDRPGTLFAVARSAEEAVRYAETLESGVHGIVLETDDGDVVWETDRRLRARGVQPATERPTMETTSTKGGKRSKPARRTPRSRAGSLSIETATVTRVSDAGSGQRVCVDCTEAFHDGEGMLVGSTSRSFALVHAETIPSEFVNARPFRVNAGAIHSYVIAPEGRTAYLSELHTGGQACAVDRQGRQRTLSVGRAKIEHRPHTLIEWQSKDGTQGSAILQTAETIRLVGLRKRLIAVTDLKVGDKIRVHNETTARHTGVPVDERVIER